MLRREGLDENLRFLILEVTQQVEKTNDYWGEPSQSLLESVTARDDYIDNLRSIIERKCFKLVAEDAESVDLLKSIDIVTVNLERIADFCERVIDQVGYIEEAAIRRAWDFQPFFEEILAAVRRVEKAALEMDLEEALKICRAEDKLDDLYAEVFREVLAALREGNHTQSLVTILFIAHYLERMGDSLLNIGEAIMSACLGVRIKIGQFQALQDSLEDMDGDWSERLDEVRLQAVGETKSGCRIDRVTRRVAGEERDVIFKEGRTPKLIEEKEALETWAQLVPGLVPRVYSFHTEGDNSAILLEFLRGRTFEDMVMRGPWPVLERGLERLCEQLVSIWQQTRRDQPSTTKFSGQLLKRLPDVYAVHPGYQDPGAGIGNVEVVPFEGLAREAARIEEELHCPFSVRIHGDFNVDNVIFGAGDERLHFIDMHRSRMTDFAQDVSVFLVSNHRLPVFQPEVRDRINRVTLLFYDFAHAFAQEAGDLTFDARLALGVARSFATSTRFVLDETFARAMFLRARYLLEKLLSHDRRDFESFVLPKEALID